MLEFIQYFPLALTFINILTLILGVIGGLILGATPGLSPTMAVALLVPFTFHMDATTGLILLGAVYTSTVAGGAISAILINIPGAPANIATLLDGHPMAKQGKSQMALYMCFISSLIGGLFGMLIMVLFTPPMAKIALKFGPSEMFWVAIVPALIGLFAIPQVFSLAEKLNTQIERPDYKPQKGILLKTFIANLKMGKALGIGSIVGTIIGVIPGAGGQVSGLIAYDQIRKFSKKTESFGKGNPEGVVAAESANNAMVGPSLIPLLTLSVPGSPTAAVLLGGLLIHGLFPGPDLFLNNVSITYAFIASLVLAQFAMCIFGLTMSRYSYMVMSVPNLYMIAAVTVLAVFGTYSVQNSFADVIVMFALGTLMYIGNKFGFSAAPVVLGIILGPIAEDNFLKGKLIAETDIGVFNYFFTGPMNIIIILLCATSIGYSIYGEIKAIKKAKESQG
jgi:putative tricarboxylic transport membrane protein